MRLIDTEEVIKAVDKHTFETKDGLCLDDDISIILEDVPTVEERRMGKWIVTSEFEDCRYAKCNQCKVTQVFYYNKPLTNYCPNCGARMEGGA